LVAAACLYTACRLEKTSHLLLDFSEVLKEDVFVIGSCFMHLILKLEWNDSKILPPVEPWLYVRRFASKLEFGAKTQQVVNTALKLISRMNRDW
jgi:transcription factor IIIB subunit 2